MRQVSAKRGTSFEFAWTVHTWWYCPCLRSKSFIVPILQMRKPRQQEVNRPNNRSNKAPRFHVWKQFRRSTDRWINKILVSPNNGILFSHEKEEHTDTCFDMDESWNQYTKVKAARHKRPPTVGFHLYDRSRTGKSIETESELEVARGWGWVSREWLVGPAWGMGAGETKML